MIQKREDSEDSLWDLKFERQRLINMSLKIDSVRAIIVGFVCFNLNVWIPWLAPSNTHTQIQGLMHALQLLFHWVIFLALKIKLIFPNPSHFPLPPFFPPSPFPQPPSFLPLSLEKGRPPMYICQPCISSCCKTGTSSPIKAEWGSPVRSKGSQEQATESEDRPCFHC